MGGFAVAAARAALPDTGVLSYGEVIDQGRNICQAVTIPVIGDGDTGYGNAISVKRTVAGYAAAGFAGVMIEDQLAPKRCGHTAGKAVVDRDAALTRMRAVLDARAELRDRGADLVVVARTDARATEGLDEALWRADRFAEMGAEIVFVEAPRSLAEMERIATEVGAASMANMVEGGVTPLLPPDLLQELGYRIAAYPLTLLSAAVAAMRDALAALAEGRTPDGLVAFDDLRELVDFDAYDAEARRYSGG